jgi:NitT/TauT family transport system permease protein
MSTTGHHRCALRQSVWLTGFIAAFFWALTAIVTVALPDVVVWGSANLFAIIMGVGAAALAGLAFAVPRLGKFGDRVASIMVHG